MFESAAVRTAAVFYFSLRRFVTEHKPPSDAKENIANFKALICKALKCEFLFCDACALACSGMLRKSVSVLIQYEKPVLQKAINPHDCTIPIKKAQIYYFSGSQKLYIDRTIHGLKSTGIQIRMNGSVYRNLHKRMASGSISMRGSVWENKAWEISRAHSLFLRNKRRTRHPS